jgi:hypothetical protein
MIAYSCPCPTEGPNPSKGPKEGRRLWVSAAPLDPDLAAVMAAWPALPEAVRAGIVAMVKASVP